MLVRQRLWERLQPPVGVPLLRIRAPELLVAVERLNSDADFGPLLERELCEVGFAIGGFYGCTEGEDCVACGAMEESNECQS